MCRSFALLAWLALAATTSAASISAIRDVGDFRPTGISNTGIVVGVARSAGPVNAVEQWGRVLDLVTEARTTLPGYTPVVSPGGLLAYRAPWTWDGGSYATLRTAEGDRSLGQIPSAYSGNVYGGGGHSTPVAVNDRGEVVGSSYAGGRYDHAFFYGHSDYDNNRWNPGVRMNDLGTFGGLMSGATDLNAKGEVVGWKDNGRFSTHAFLGGADLGTLGGKHSRATAINDRGQVVGWSNIRDEQSVRTSDNSYFTFEAEHAFRYENDRMSDLGTPERYKASRALDINNSGLVLAAATRADGGSRPFLIEDGRWLDLNALLPQGTGWMLESALAINDLGQVVGDGTYQGQKRGYVLQLDGWIQPTPVPEPAVLAMVPMVVAGVLARRIRRRRGAGRASS